MKCEINLMWVQRFDEGTEDTISTITNLIRLLYEIPNIEKSRMLPYFRGFGRFVLTKDY